MIKKKTILCIDDEIQILNSLKRIFRKVDITLITTSLPEEGIQIAKKNYIDLAIVDYKMPKMNGIEVITELKKINNNTTCIILSGYADSEILNTAMNDGQIYSFILKPWSEDELKRTIAKIFSYNNGG